jgi:predicted RNase H-like nuclease (RuvC/YqgF family)
MKSKNDNHKIAMKLANQYAESYKILEVENRRLKRELEDTLTCLTINKSMITDLTNPMQINHTEKIIIDSLKRENQNMLSIIESYRIENNELKQLLHMNQNNIEPILTKNKKTIDNLQNKVFVLENSIFKKDNIIKQLNNKLDEAVYCKVAEKGTIIQEIAVSSLYVIFILDC